MQAAVLTSPRTIEIQDVEPPRLQPGQVRIAIEGCGVCASNLPPFEGREWFQYPFAPGSPGHEGWGVVDEVGPGVRDLNAGDRVTFLSSAAYATHDVAPAEHVVKLPDALAGRELPGEPLACAMNIFRRSDVRPEQTVAIVGIGFLGAALTALASRAGARVIAISRRRSSLELAERFGAAVTIPMEDHGRIVSEVLERTGGAGCERVIEAVGAQWPLDLAAELVRVRGRLVIAGYHQDGPRQVDLQSWNWRGLDVVNAHERDPAQYVRGMREAVDAVVAGHLDPAPLITHRFPLERLGDALTTTAERPDGFVKALIVNAVER